MVHLKRNINNKMDIKEIKSSGIKENGKIDLELIDENKSIKFHDCTIIGDDSQCTDQLNLTFKYDKYELALEKEM